MNMLLSQSYQHTELVVTWFILSSLHQGGMVGGGPSHGDTPHHPAHDEVYSYRVWSKHQMQSQPTSQGPGAQL